jgi:hypothetical protein
LISTMLASCARCCLHVLPLLITLRAKIAGAQSDVRQEATKHRGQAVSGCHFGSPASAFACWLSVDPLRLRSYVHKRVIREQNLAKFPYRCVFAAQAVCSVAPFSSSLTLLAGWLECRYQLWTSHTQSFTECERDIGDQLFFAFCCSRVVMTEPCFVSSPCRTQQGHV